MSVCAKCKMFMSESDYASEGLCHECFYESVLEQEAELEAQAELDPEVEKHIDDMLKVLYPVDEENL